MDQAPGSPQGPEDHSAQPARSPGCYRHPDRETGIRCTRCDRPICPDCMVSAAVGFQCPECVREGRKTTRAPRTALGAKVSPQAQAAQLTKLLIAANAVVFVAAKILKAPFVDRLYLIGKAGFVASVGHPVGVEHGEYYRLFTAMFLHLEVWHIAANMWALWVLGPPLEAVLGRLRFLGLYV